MSTCDWGDCPESAGYEVIDDDEESGVMMLCREHAEALGVRVVPNPGDGAE